MAIINQKTNKTFFLGFFHKPKYYHIKDNYMKKTLTTILSLIMAVTLTSCDIPKEPQANISETAQTGQQPNDTPSTIIYEIPAYDSDHLISSIEEINKRLVELDKEYRVEFRKMGGRETLSKLASSGEVDIVTVCDRESGKELGEDGTLLELTDYLSSEKGQQLYESITEDMWHSIAINGKIYGANGYLYAGSIAPCYNVNRALMEEYNLNEKDFQCSIAELEDIFDMVKNGEGESFHPLKINGANHISGMETISKSVSINLKTNKAELLLDNENYMSIMKDIYDMNDKGYVSVASDLGGVGLDEENYLVSFFFNTFALDAVDDYRETGKDCPKFTANDLLQIVWEGYDWYSAATWPATCVCAMSEKQEQALDLITAIYTDQTLSNLFLYGVEGVNYTIHENRGVVSESFHPLIAAKFGNQLTASPFYADLKEFYIEKHKKLIDNPFLDFTGYTPPSIKTDDLMNLLYEGLIDGKKYDEMVSELKTKLEESGAYEYIDNLNKKVEEYLSNR